MSGHNGLRVNDVVAFNKHREDLSRPYVPWYRVRRLKGDGTVLITGGMYEKYEAKADELTKINPQPFRPPVKELAR